MWLEDALNSEGKVARTNDFHSLSNTFDLFRQFSW